MKRTIINEQILMIRIESPSWVACAQGFSEVIPGKEWYVGEFTTQKAADDIFEKIKQRYQVEEVANQSWMKEPTMSIEWETTSTRVIPE